MRELNEKTKEELKELVYDFFAEECEVEVEEIKLTTTISEDLDGDSLLLVELIELAKKKYDLDIKLQSVGKYLLKNELDTVEEVLEVFYKIYMYENDIVNLED